MIYIIIYTCLCTIWSAYSCYIMIKRRKKFGKETITKIHIISGTVMNFLIFPICLIFSILKGNLIKDNFDGGWKLK